MKRITNISVRNMLGANEVNIRVGNVTLIAGPNKAGKTSTLDAIAYCITGDKYRNLTPIKKSDVLAGEVLSESHVVIHGAEGVMAAVVDGKPSGSVGEYRPVTVIPGHYAGLSRDHRIQVLLSACGIVIDPREVIAQISGLSKEQADTVISRAIIDLDTAESYCRESARKYKARWQGITGQEWGVKKAASWRPQMPDGNKAELHSKKVAIDVEITMERGRYNKLREELGAAKAAESVVPQRSLEVIDALRAAEQKEIDRLTLITGTQGTIEPCPHCGAMVVRPAAGGALRKAADDEKYIPEASKELIACRQRLNTLDSERARAQGALALQADHRPVATIEADIAESARLGKQHAADLDKIVSTLSAIEAAEADLAASIEAHQSIVAMLAAADELSPSGFRQRKLSAAVTMVNAALPALGPYRLDEDGAVVGFEREASIGRQLDVSWLSKSEQWRANAAVAMALAGISGRSLVLLDEFDVIEPAGRMDVLDEIVRWSSERSVQVIIAATLKGPPAIDGISVNWIGG